MGASSAYRTVHLVSDDVILWSHRMNHTRIVHVHVYGLRSNATLFLHCIVHSYFTIGVLYGTLYILYNVHSSSRPTRIILRVWNKYDI